MTKAVYRKIRGRFHELVLAESFGHASAADVAKLHRYQALLRYRPSRREMACRSRFEYQGWLMLKVARAMALERTPDPWAVAMLHSRFWETR